MIFLGRADIEDLLDPVELIAELEQAFASLSDGDASAPARIAASAPGGKLLAMPGFVNGVFATKLVTLFPATTPLGLPTHQALIALFDPDDGTPLAVLDGRAHHRHSHRGHLGARGAARRAERRPFVAILGAGVQGRAHAEVFESLLGIEEIMIASRNDAKARALAEALGVGHETSFEAAVRGADIVCACTHATSPVLLRRVGFGPVRMWARWEPATVTSSTTRPSGRGCSSSSRASPSARSPPAHVTSSTSIRRSGWSSARSSADGIPGRTSPGQITVFKSIGHAIEDAVAAALVLRLAARTSRGVSVPL